MISTTSINCYLNLLTKHLQLRNSLLEGLLVINLKEVREANDTIQNLRSKISKRLSKRMNGKTSKSNSTKTTRRKFSKSMMTLLKEFKTLVWSIRRRSQECRISTENDLTQEQSRGAMVEKETYPGDPILQEQKLGWMTLVQITAS